ncbi:MAG: MFS transporter [Elusimicrobia bacterium]|nr:MFS transporter [Elusimicrobiota bacterium]
MFSLLANRNFLFLWLGQLCSQFGDRLTQLVLVALVTIHAPGSPLTLAKVLVATSLPALLINPVAGVYVDRWDRKRTMITCDLIRAFLILALPWIIFLPESGFFYGAVFMIFAVATFFVPARLSIIPDLVAPGKLAQANALFTASGMIGSMVILLVGALLVEWVGVRRSCWVNGASYLLSALAIAPVLRPRKVREVKSASLRLIFREVAEGMRELWRHPQTRRVAGLLGLLMGGAGSSFVVATVLVQEHLHSLTKDLGFLSLWLGVGMLLGSLGHGRWGTNRPKRLVLGLSFLGCGVALWAFVAAVAGLKSGAGACAAGVLLGFWISPVGIVTNTLVHEGHPERLHGRIFGSLGVVVNLSLIGSMLISGWLAERGGREALLGSVGGIFAATGLCLLILRRKMI